MQSALTGTVRAFVASIDARDPFTQGHSSRVAKLARTVGRKLEHPEKFLGDLGLAGYLHDIGKIGLTDAVLHAPGSLSDKEWSVIQKLPVIGEEIILNMDLLAHLGKYVRHCHERIDGSGYPDGLSGEDIPLVSRVIAVVEAYDAMQSSRRYRAALTQSEIFQELLFCAGKQLDPKIVRALIECQDEISLIKPEASQDDSSTEHAVLEVFGSEES